MTSWFSVGVVTLAAILAFWFSAQQIQSPKYKEISVSGWQTYCAFAYEHRWTTAPEGKLSVEAVGRPSADIHFAQLFQHADELRVWDLGNNEQFALRNGRFEAAEFAPCEPFRANGWTFSHTNGRITACRGNGCRSVSILPRTVPLMFAAKRQGVAIGTSHGDVLLFRGGKWCRMRRDGQVWSCPGRMLPIVNKPSNQFYSSISFGRTTLVGEYPTGKMYSFDGHQLRSWSTAPKEALTWSAEPQSFAFYCGELYVGYWPRGEVWRYADGSWKGPIRLFSTPPEPNFPFQMQAEEAGLIGNFFGRRVPSLIPHGDSLYAVTSNKGDWSRRTPVQVDGADEYGAVWKIRRDGCFTY
ncbi:hypothetical protein [Pseudaminobacter sp. NGMCC 1.201702]|uniref:hypothetical protein n=1 Tax=Pseudaminobacter sp. NGMCC 1.201702 TaxID=3391825 RepID=UPI0039EF1BA4